MARGHAALLLKGVTVPLTVSSGREGGRRGKRERRGGREGSQRREKQGGSVEVRQGGMGWVGRGKGHSRRGERNGKYI